MDAISFILKDNNKKAFNYFFGFFLFLHIISAGIVFLSSEDGFYHKLAGVAMMAFLGSAIIYFIIKNKFKQAYLQLAMFLMMIVFWLLLKAWIPLFISISAVAFSFKILKTQSQVFFNAQKITLKKSMLLKNYDWSELDNVVLKDGLLSLDFKNNKLLQFEIIPESSTQNPVEFNKFCKNQLAEG